ncbi:hypothetical protein K469DRAFT_51552 [Zopfia rhizophila CBS 207.26]|uniref:Uncharacterized protein n=1 Tax=Zopfia rhizophila CBS 207.26 TaxID=1314779 RepID=A0A6A6DEE4_9PEZI|nr:hypothetical protein K469DRAFT_51552 [Zopfia rhizophila CBS 207.26]
MTTTQTRDIAGQDLHPAYSLNPQSFSNWITRSQAGQLLPSFVAKRTRSNAHTELYIRPDQLCPSKVNNESCWTVIASRELFTQLGDRVATLLKSSTDHFYKRERRVLSTYFELYLVGPSESEARPTMVISCTSKDDYKRVKGLIKKHCVLIDFPSVNLAATIGSPRSSRALEPLAGGDENGPAIARPTGNRDHSWKDAAQPGDHVYVIPRDGRGLELHVPQTVYITSNHTHFHKAVLGGLLKSGKNGEVYGLTVAHAFDHHGANTSGHETPESLDKVSDSPAAIATTSETTPPSAPSGLSNKATDKSAIKTLIGTITKTSQTSADHDLDWALVDIERGVNLFQSVSMPRIVAPIPAEPKLIKLLRPEGGARGTLSPSPTYIRVHDGADFVSAWAITVDRTIKRGDCGSWVVDELTNSLYGHVAYGHPGDKVAYIVPAQEIFAQIRDTYDGTLTPAFKTVESTVENQKRERRGKLRDERRRAHRDAGGSPAKAWPASDIDSDDRRRSTRTLKRRSRLLDRMRRSRKERRKRESLVIILKAAGTCFFLSVLLFGLIAVHFGLALFANFMTDNKLDELRAFLMEMLMQCFQLLIRETLVTEDSESLQEYYKDQMARLRDIHPPRERIARLKKAFEPGTERTGAPDTNARSNPQKSSQPNLNTDGPMAQTPTAFQETPKPEKKWRKIWKIMKGRKSPQLKSTEPQAPQPQPKPQTLAAERTAHDTPYPEEEATKRGSHSRDADDDKDSFDQGPKLTYRSRSGSYDRSRPRVEPRRRYSGRSTSMSRSPDRDRISKRRSRTLTGSTRILSGVQKARKLIEYAGDPVYSPGPEYPKRKEETASDQDKDDERKNVRFNESERGRDGERDRDAYEYRDGYPADTYYPSTNSFPPPPELPVYDPSDYPPPAEQPVYVGSGPSREAIIRRETRNPVIEEIFTDEEDIKAGTGDREEAEEYDIEANRRDNVTKTRTTEGDDDITFQEFAPDGVEDEDVLMEGEEEREGRYAAYVPGGDLAETRADSGGSGVEDRE